MARDRHVDCLLCSLGWIVLHFWEKEVKKDLDGCIQTVESAIFESWLQRLSLEESCITGSGPLEPYVPYPDPGPADRLDKTDH